MKTFPDWRAVGAAMRWARSSGSTCHRTRYGRPHVFPDGSQAQYIVLGWTTPAGARVVVGSYAGRTDPDMSVVNGSARRDLYPETATEALEVLTELGVIPSDLMEASK